MLTGMRRTLAIAAVALVLTGCSSREPEGRPVGERDPEPTSTVECLTVTDGALNGLQAHAKDNVTFTRAVAVTDAPEGPWYVAAEFNIDFGYDDVETDTAVWITQQDPTASDDAAYLAVDALAEEVADFYRLPNGSAAAPGAIAAQECLEQ